MSRNKGDPTQQEKEAILSLVRKILRESPKTPPQEALRYAKSMVQHGKVSPDYLKTPFKRLPWHIKETIKKQKRAERERKESGGSLPRAHFVSGGKVSPK